MYISDRLYSEAYDETMFSIALTEEEYTLFSMFQRMYAESVSVEEYVNGLKNSGLSDDEIRAVLSGEKPKVTQPLPEGVRKEMAKGRGQSQAEAIANYHEKRRAHKAGQEAAEKATQDRIAETTSTSHRPGHSGPASTQVTPMSQETINNLDRTRQENRIGILQENLDTATSKAAKEEKRANDLGKHAGELSKQLQGEQAAHKATTAERDALKNESLWKGAKRHASRAWGEGGIKSGWKANWKGRAGLIGGGAAAAGVAGLAGYGAYKAATSKRDRR